MAEGPTASEDARTAAGVRVSARWQHLAIGMVSVVILRAAGARAARKGPAQDRPVLPREPGEGASGAFIEPAHAAQYFSARGKCSCAA